VVVLGVLLGLLNLLAVAYCVLDVATSRRADVRVLPKALWFLVLLLPVVGPASWLLLGRPAPGSGRAVPKVLPDAAPPPSTPDDDEEFLRQLRRRAEEQRRDAELEERRREDQQRRRAERGDEDRPA
jgi:hypothetical protein